MENELANQFKKLKKIEKNFFGMTVGGYYIYPFVRTKLYGMILNHMSLGEKGTKSLRQLPGPSDRNCYISQALERIPDDVDTLLIPFYRFDFSENRIVDEKSDFVWTSVNGEWGKVLRLVYRNQSGFQLAEDNTYYLTDLMTIAESNPLTIKGVISDEELVELRKFEKAVQSEMGFLFPLGEYINEFYNRGKIIGDFLDALLDRIKPKRIVMPASYLFPQIQIAAKKHSIPLIDIQYAAFTPNHVGYDYDDQYPFFPDKIIGWGKEWDKREIFGPQAYSFAVMPSKSTYKAKTLNPQKVVFISQNLITKLVIRRAARFSDVFEDYKVVVKLHPNDSLSAEMKEMFSSRKNLSYAIDSSYLDAKYVVGVGSSLIFELNNSGRSIIVMSDVYLSALIEDSSFTYSSNLIEDFKNIIAEKEPISKSGLNSDDLMKLQNNSSPIRFNLVKTDLKKLLSIVVTVTSEEILNFRLLWFSISQLTLWKSGRLEVIFVDVDDSGIANQFFESDVRNIKIITLTKRKVRMEARLAGFKSSVGKYVYFLDGDDYLNGTELDRAVNLASQKDAEVVVAGVILKKEKNSEISIRKTSEHFFTSRELFFDSEISTKVLFLHNHIYKRSTLHIPYFENVKDIEIGEDHFFNNLVYMNSDSFLELPFALNIYVKHGDPETAKPLTAQQYEMILNRMVSHLISFEPRPENLRYVRNYIRNFYLNNLQVRVLKDNPHLVTKEVSLELTRVNDAIRRRFGNAVPLYKTTLKDLRRRISRLKISGNVYSDLESVEFSDSIGQSIELSDFEQSDGSFVLKIASLSLGTTNFVSKIGREFVNNSQAKITDSGLYIISTHKILKIIKVDNEMLVDKVFGKMTARLKKGRVRVSFNEKVEGVINGVEFYSSQLDLPLRKEIQIIFFKWDNVRFKSLEIDGEIDVQFKNNLLIIKPQRLTLSQKINIMFNKIFNICK